MTQRVKVVLTKGEDVRAKTVVHHAIRERSRDALAPAAPDWYFE
jgi:hypothetical protein